MARAYSVNELYTKKWKEIHLPPEWAEHLGLPEPCKSWLIWGDSSNGKTTYALKMAKMLSKFGRVVYNSMEEGFSKSMTRAFKRVGMEEVRRRVLILDNEPMDELEKRLEKKKSPRIVFIDTVQYSELTFAEYKRLKEKFPNVLWIYISHEDGKLPDGKVAKRIRRDAMIKIRVDGFKAKSISRYQEDTKDYIVWAEGAAKHHAALF